jgi:hypothetical protein
MTAHHPFQIISDNPISVAIAAAISVAAPLFSNLIFICAHHSPEAETHYAGFRAGLQRRGFGRGKSFSVLLRRLGRHPCIQTYRSGLRAHGKSNDKIRRCLTELSVPLYLGQLRSLFGPATPQQPLLRSPMQRSARAHAGSQARLIRRPVSLQLCTQRFSRLGGSDFNEQQNRSAA